MRYAQVLSIALCNAVLVSVGPRALHAQVPIYFDLEIGARSYLTRPPETAFAKFMEYRDLSSGAVFPSLRAWSLTDDTRHEVQLGARNFGQADERLWLRALQIGSLSFEVEREKTPHIFSTTARSLLTSSEPGVYELSTPRPTAEQFKGAPLLNTVSTRWTSDRIALKLTPMPTFVTSVQYNRVEKRGERPMAQNASMNFHEILEPVAQSVQQIRVMPAWYGQNLQLQLVYDYAAFENELGAVTAANPLVAIDHATSGAAYQRSALAPDNHAHKLAFQAGARLPARSRVTAALSYGWRTQIDAFVPYTSNTAINTSALTPLPTSLSGDVRTLVFNTSASTRPLTSLTFGVRYRMLDVDDRTPRIKLAGRVVTDRSLSLAEVHSHRYPYSRQNATAEARWRPFRAVALQASYAIENWERDADVREVANASERMPKVVLDLTPTYWLTVRSSFMRAERHAHAYQSVIEAQAPELRKYDQADRDRDRFDVVADVALPANFGLALTYALADSDYPESRLGRTADHNRAAGMELSWSYRNRVSAYASYLRENVAVRQTSRYRVAPALLDNASYDWVGQTDDDVRNLGAALSLTVFPKKLDIGANWDRSVMESRTTAKNPSEPTGGTAAQNTSATAVDFPLIAYEFNPASFFIRWRLSDNWSAMGRYSYERFRQTDFRTDDLGSTLGNSVLLASDAQNYRAQLLTLTMRYQPLLTRPRPVF